MNKYNKGFVSIIILIIAGVLVLVGGYYLYNKSTTNKNQAMVENVIPGGYKWLYYISGDTEEVITVNLANNKQSSLAKIDQYAGYQFIPKTQEVVYVKGSKIFSQSRNSQPKLVLDTAGILDNKWKVGGIAVSPDESKVVFSLNNIDDYGKSRIYRYDILNGGKPVLIKETSNIYGDLSYDWYPYLWDSSNTIYVRKVAPVDCGGGVSFINQNGQEINQKIPVSDIMADNKYSLFTKTTNNSAFLNSTLGMCGGGGLDNSLVLYDATTKKESVLVDNQSEELTPLGVSQNGKFAVYEIQKLSIKGRSATEEGTPTFGLIDTKTKEGKSFSTIGELSQFIKNSHLGDDIIFKYTAPPEANGDVNNYHSTSTVYLNGVGIDIDTYSILLGAGK